MVMPFSTCCLDAGEGQKSPQESWVVPKVSTDMLNKSSAVHLGVWNRSHTTNKSCNSIHVTMCTYLFVIYMAWNFVEAKVLEGIKFIHPFRWIGPWIVDMMIGNPMAQTYRRIVILQNKIPNMTGKRLEWHLRDILSWKSDFKLRSWPFDSLPRHPKTWEDIWSPKKNLLKTPNLRRYDWISRALKVTNHCWVHWGLMMAMGLLAG